MTILLVEDEIFVREYLREALTDEGFDVVAVSAGGQAIAELEAQGPPYEAVVTDIRLADKVLGWEVAKVARQLNPAIPVIYMTGDSAADWAVQGVPDSTILPKPFGFPRLLAAVRSG